MLDSVVNILVFLISVSIIILVVGFLAIGSMFFFNPLFAIAAIVGVVSVLALALCTEYDNKKEEEIRRQRKKAQIAKQQTQKTTSSYGSSSTATQRTTSYAQRDKDSILIAISLIEKFYRVGRDVTNDHPINGYVVMAESSDKYFSFYIQLVGYGTLYCTENGFKDKYYYSSKYNIFEPDNSHRAEIYFGEHYAFVIHQESGHPLSCGWTNFNKAVWDELRSKHPDWNFREVRPGEIGVDL